MCIDSTMGLCSNVGWLRRMKRTTKKISRNRNFAGKALRNAAYKQRIVPSYKLYTRKAKHKEAEPSNVGQQEGQ